MPSAPDDGALVRHLKTGDPDAFRAFFERHRAPVYRTVRALTGDEQLTEEVLQDTFVRAFQHRRSLREDVSPLPWLHRVALNLCYTRLGRRRVRWEPISEAVVRLLHDLSPTPDVAAERTELRQIVRDGVLGLPPRHQAVVVLFYLQGLSLQETADALGLPVGTVKSRLHYALQTLRARLEEDARFRGAWATAGRRLEAP